MPLKKNDFIEIEFTAKTKEGNIFDSNIKEDLQKINPQIQAKPLIIVLGQEMFLKSVEDFLIEKNIGEYKVELSPEKAFGNRNPELIKRIPMKVFKEQQINPIPGAIFNFDGRIGKILSASGGRILTDFNNPIAGKDVIYDINVKRIVTDLNEKVKSIIEFLFRKDFEFKIEEKKIVLNVDKGMKQFAGLFKDKFKDILGLDLEVKEIENKKNIDKEQ
ncbi:MAG: peptidylprolyl isomerase [Nanoarchaeota archaeon]|nr:peptidylprolyl isomerase [Nanoarchaeota archaeon]MBU1028358.1 peptidylprolyl isomerase [Nanoarchaeota archaeon]